MSKTVRPLYAAASAAVTFTSLSGLASSSTAGVGAESAPVDNSQSPFGRARFHGNFCIGGGTIANDQAIYVFLYPIIPNLAGDDAAVGSNRVPQMVDQTLPRTLPNATSAFPETMPGVRLIAVVPVSGPAVLVEWTCLVKDLPRKFGLFVRNNCGAALAASASIPTWTVSTSYTAGTLVAPTTSNGHKYLCVTGGTGGTTEPTWANVAGNKTISDGGATWLDIGLDAPNTIYYQGENDQIS